MVKKLSSVSCGSLKRFPHTFTTPRHHLHKHYAVYGKKHILLKIQNMIVNIHHIFILFI